jgi:transposase
MVEGSRYVGLDVHKETIAVAVADGAAGEPVYWGTIRNRPEAVLKLVRKLGAGEHLRVCYEAGPTGYGLQRQLTRLGVACAVVAPSLVPTKAGDRVKTDRRDALKLARLLRSGELTTVWVPDEVHEALRDLTRAREAAKQDLHRARQRLGVFGPPGLRRWGKPYRAWLGTLQLPQPLEQAVLEDALVGLDWAQARLERLSARLALVAAESEHAPLSQALQCLRGVAVVTAVTRVAELGDLRRFATARQLMGYLGLGAREASSGGRVRRGGITKTGNSHGRRVLVEAAWHYRRAPQVGPALRKRRAGQPGAVIAIADHAQERLHRRYRKLVGRGKLPQQAVVAVARELAGFVWAMARQVPARFAPVLAASGANAAA